MHRYKSSPCRTLVLLVLLIPCRIEAQAAQIGQPHSIHPGAGDVETAGLRSCSGVPDRADRQKLENEATKRLPEMARFWLTEDAASIISREERCAFLLLKTDSEREQFVEQFWSMRAPDPTSLTNTFKQSYYERVAFADSKFGSDVPGFATDRGRIYITLGPPDSIEFRREGETTCGPPGDGTETCSYSQEVWHYKQTKTLGNNVALKFEDAGGRGDYRLAAPAEMKDDLVYPPSYIGHSIPQGANADSAQQIEIYIGPLPTPCVQFKDLEAVAVARIIREQFHFNYRIEFARATHATTLTRIFIDIPDLQRRSEKNFGGLTTGFRVFGRVSKLTGWVVDTFERGTTLDSQPTSEQRETDPQFSLAITPGTYQLALIVQNMDDSMIGTVYASISVPAYDDIPIAKSVGD